VKVVVVGTDYFADRFLYLIKNVGVHAERVSKIPAKLDFDAVFFSGAACTMRNISRSLKEGLHVFSEQILFDSGDVTGFVDYAKRHGLKLYLGSFDIFNPVVRQVMELVKNQDIGSVRLDRIGPVSHSNINLIEDSVLHGIGTLRYILGDKRPVEIQACFSDNAHSQCTLMLKIGDLDGMIYASNKNRYKERTVDVFCRSMRARVDITRQELYVLDSRNSDINLCEAGVWSFRRYYVKKEEPLKVLIHDFLEKDGNPLDYGFIKGVLRTAFEVKRKFLYGVEHGSY